MPHRINHVLVVGAGWVGRQVAARFAQFGYEVWLSDRDEAICAEAIQWAATQNDFPLPGVETETPIGEDRSWVERLHIAPPIAKWADDNMPVMDLVLENVPEQLSLKKRVLRMLSSIFASPTIIASNSSYFVPSILSQFVDDHSRFAHLHFHVPVLHDSVVDIVGVEATSDDTIAALQTVCERIEQEPLVLNREHPGYIFNWLLQSMLRSALELSVLDVASREDIDKSWTTITGMPLGPFGIMDQIGIDVIEQVLANARWAESAKVSDQQLIEHLRKWTDEGHVGKKAGRGFYDYGGSAAETELS